MKFYDPNKTFLDLVTNYQGDMDEAFNLFSNAYDAAIESGKENRPVNEALGIPDLADFSLFMSDKITAIDLLKKYGKSAAAVSV